MGDALLAIDSDAVEYEDREIAEIESVLGERGLTLVNGATHIVVAASAR